MTDAGGLIEDHDAGAMTVAVPGTQQGPGCHPSRPQRVAGLLFQVLGVVVHSHIVARIPAESSIVVSNQELHCGVTQGNNEVPHLLELELCELTGFCLPNRKGCRVQDSVLLRFGNTEPKNASVCTDADSLLGNLTWAWSNLQIVA